jgi:hypothetical protein
MMAKPRKKFVICFCEAYSAASSNKQAWLMGLSFTPSAFLSKRCDAIDLDVVISGGENAVQRYAFKNLAGFDFHICYSSDIADSENSLPISGCFVDTEDNAKENSLKFSHRFPLRLSDPENTELPSLHISPGDGIGNPFSVIMENRDRESDPEWVLI